MKRVTYLLLSLGIWLSCLMNAPQRVNATENGAGFTMTAIQGRGQTDTALGYTSLKVVPNQTYPISVEVENLSQQTSEFQVELVAASTSNALQINYAPNQQKSLVNKAQLLTQLVAPSDKKQTLTLAPLAKKTVTFTIKIPAKGIQGQLLGSIYVAKKTAANSKVKKGLGFRNRFAMTSAVLVTQDPMQRPSPVLKLRQARLVANSGLPQVTGRISNEAPVMFGNIKTKAQIINRTTKQVLYERQTQHGEMAPQSTFSYDIDTQQKLLPVGRYTMKVQVSSGEKQFKLQQHFTVDQTSREAVNQQLLHPEKQSINWWLWLVIGVSGLIIVALGAYVIGRRRGVG